MHSAKVRELKKYLLHHLVDDLIIYLSNSFCCITLLSIPLADAGIMSSRSRCPVKNITTKQKTIKSSEVEYFGWTGNQVQRLNSV